MSPEQAQVFVCCRFRNGDFIFAAPVAQLSLNDLTRQVVTRSRRIAGQLPEISFIGRRWRRMTPVGV